MRCNRWTVSIALAAALIVANAAASAHDESKYPDWTGQWRRPPGVGIQWDPSKPLGPTQQAPLTPKYQKIFEASLADQKAACGASLRGAKPRGKPAEAVLAKERPEEQSRGASGRRSRPSGLRPARDTSLPSENRPAPLPRDSAPGRQERRRCDSVER